MGEPQLAEPFVSQTGTSLEYAITVPIPERLAQQFEEHRSHLRAVAYRMLGSVSKAEDAVQEAWIRLAARMSVVSTTCGDG